MPDTAYIAFVATDGTNNLYVSNSSFGQPWSPSAPVNQAGQTSPALAVLSEIIIL